MKTFHANKIAVKATSLDINRIALEIIEGSLTIQFPFQKTINDINKQYQQVFPESTWRPVTIATRAVTNNLRKIIFNEVKAEFKIFPETKVKAFRRHLATLDVWSKLFCNLHLLLRRLFAVENTFFISEIYSTKKRAKENQSLVRLKAIVL